MNRTILAAVLAVALAPSLALAAAGGDEPQLLSGVSRGLITGLTTLVIFLILLAVLGKYAWGPIVAGLKSREDKIRKDIADAEAARARAEATLRDYEQKLAKAQDDVRALLQQAKVEGESLAAQIRARGQQEAEEAKERAVRDIDSSRKAAITEIYAQAAELSTNIAEKILRRNLNVDDQRELVRSSLDQFQGVNRG